MNKKTISLILLIIFLITSGLTIANVFLQDTNTDKNHTGNLTINNQTVHFEKSGKCLEVIDGNTIQVYGVGRVQLTQVDTPQGVRQDLVKQKVLLRTNALEK